MGKAGSLGPDVDDQLPVQGFYDFDERIEGEVVRFGAFQFSDERLADSQSPSEGLLGQALPLPEANQGIHQP